MSKRMISENNSLESSPVREILRRLTVGLIPLWLTVGCSEQDQPEKARLSPPKQTSSSVDSEQQLTADKRFGTVYHYPRSWERSAEKVYIGDYRQLLRHENLGVEVDKAIKGLDGLPEVTFRLRYISDQPQSVEACAFDANGGLVDAYFFRPPADSEIPASDKQTGLRPIALRKRRNSCGDVPEAVDFAGSGMALSIFEIRLGGDTTDQIAIMIRRRSGNAVFVFLGAKEMIEQEWLNPVER